jgi:hypothetical protein
MTPHRRLISLPQPKLHSPYSTRSRNTMQRTVFTPQDPTTLDELTAAQLPSLRGRGYLYSASGDWVYKSDACEAREKHLHGWIMKEVKEYQKEIDDFKHECVTGYRDYELQSPDFPRNAQTQYIERWAYFDSQTRQWSLGWCAKTGKKTGEISTNGMCRWRPRGGSVRW